VWDIASLLLGGMGTLPVSSVLDLASRDLARDEDNAAADMPLLDIHCTGFGRFHNIAVNPTELLVQKLPAYLLRHPLSKSCSLTSAVVFETAAMNTRVLLEHMYDKVDGTTRPNFSVSAAGTVCRKEARPPPPPRVVFVHFGLNVAITQFELELQARNEATFSCPDEAGWSPVKCRIDPDSSIPLEHVRCTSLPVRRLVAELRSSGFDVGVSSDAGRFVCNWVYYNSLRLAEPKGACALFVHVPPHASQPLETQLRFFATLVEKISALEL
jgi:pyroglutamyl-peptidase